MAREQKLGELGGKRFWRAHVGPVGGVGFITAVRGVGDHATRFIEEAFKFAPLRIGVDAAADAGDDDLFVHDFAVGEAFDFHDIGPAFRKDRKALAAVRTRSRLRHDDAAMASPRASA